MSEPAPGNRVKTKNREKQMNQRGSTQGDKMKTVGKLKNQKVLTGHLFKKPCSKQINLKELLNNEISGHGKRP
jgi:hypothetical protein